MQASPRASGGKRNPSLAVAVKGPACAATCSLCQGMQVRALSSQRGNTKSLCLDTHKCAHTHTHSNTRTQLHTSPRPHLRLRARRPPCQMRPPPHPGPPAAAAAAAAGHVAACAARNPTRLQAAGPLSEALAERTPRWWAARAESMCVRGCVHTCVCRLVTGRTPRSLVGCARGKEVCAWVCACMRV